MTIKSRLWASLAVALAMILAAGLGVAGPAAAGPDSGDLAAADATDLGAVLDVQYESQQEGIVRTTEYENATVTEFELAACSITTTAYKPYKSGTQVWGRGYSSLSSGCSGGSWEILVSLKLRIYNEFTPIDTDRLTVYAPYSGGMSTGTPCRRGEWITEIIVQRGSQDQSSRSSILNVSSC